MNDFISKRLFFKGTEFSAEEADGKKCVSGLASTFNDPDLVNDIFDPSAFDEFLKSKKMPKMFFNHRTDGVPIGKYTEIEKTAEGLRVKGYLNNTALASDVFEAIKHGDLNAFSIGFTARYSDIEQSGDFQVIKKIEDLREISIVNFPCNLNARITNVKSLSECEEVLRDAGFSRNESKIYISKIKEFSKNRDDSKDISAISEKLRKIISKI